MTAPAKASLIALFSLSLKPHRAQNTKHRAKLRQDSPSIPVESILGLHGDRVAPISLKAIQTKYRMLYQLMAKLILNDDLVLKYGFPQVCMCCGNDDITQLKQGHSKNLKSLIPLGALLLIFLLIPLDIFIPLYRPTIILGFIYVFFARFNKVKVRFEVPMCELCHKANKKFNKDLALILVGIPACLAAIIAVSTPNRTLFSLLNGPSSMVEAASYFLAWLSMFILLLTNIYFRRKFTLSFLTRKSKTTTLDVPYEDYPALYQRHLDNAILYE